MITNIVFWKSTGRTVWAHRDQFAHILLYAADFVAFAAIMFAIFCLTIVAEALTCA